MSFFFFLCSNMEMIFYFDIFSMSFMLVVLFISTYIVLFSMFYMSSVLTTFRFIMLLMLFIISMMLFIFCPNFISMFLGWDGLGLVSYLLVIYYSSYNSLNCGLLTVISNRMGDYFLMMAIFFSVLTGSSDYMFMLNNDFMLLSIMVILASFTKSAQLPFSSWLPMAMAAPTPISSLVHSSTLVTAGVFFLIRFYDFLDNNMKFFIMFSGIITMIVAGFSGLMELDLKKIVALSTLSQLGLMMMLIGLNFKSYCFFHLCMHALFKSSLFMCTGFKIYEFFGTQDSRYLNSFWKNPMFNFFFSIVNLSLVGFPFFSGFFSKDISLEMSIMSSSSNMFINFFIFLSLGLTIGYSLKFMLVSSSNFNYSYKVNMKDYMSKKNFFMTCMLVLFSIIMGFFYNKIILNYFSMMNMYLYEKIFMFFFMFFFFFFIYFFNKKSLLLLKNKKAYYFMINFLFMVDMSVYFKMMLKNMSYLSKMLDFGWLEKNFYFFINKELYNLYMFIEKNYLSKFYGFLFLFSLFIFF